MLTIQNCSSNSFAATVWGVQGSNVSVILPPGQIIHPPSLTTPGGEQVVGGMLSEATLIVSDTATGQKWDLLYARGQTVYALTGGGFALSVFAVVFLIRLVRRGIRLREGYE